MNKKLAQEIAERVIEYLFSDETGKPIDRLMIVYGGQGENKSRRPLCPVTWAAGVVVSDKTSITPPESI